MEAFRVSQIHLDTEGREMDWRGTQRFYKCISPKWENSQLDLKGFHTRSVRKVSDFIFSAKTWWISMNI